MRRRFGRFCRWPGTWLTPVFAGLLPGCAGNHPAGSAAAADPACVVSEGAARAPIRLAVTGPVRSENAPIPRNDGERLVFRQLYDTLVRVDCTGALMPGLAAKWSVADDGSTWTFELREDATFADGSAVTAADVARAWKANGADTTFTDIVAIDARELRISVRNSGAAPRILADPRFAVARRVARGWPTGTGAYRVSAASDRQLRLEPRDSTRPPIDVLILAADARAVLDDGVDALVSADAATLAYARALPGYSAVPLPWHRTYVLVGSTRDAAAVVPADARAELARDAVRGDVRPAETPQSCAADSTTRDPITRAIAYPAGDDIARGLAERIAALSWPPSREPDWLRKLVRAGSAAPTVQPLNETQMRDALRRDTTLALVLALPRSEACGTRGAALVDARGYLVHRGTIGRVVVDGDGALRFGAAR